MAKYNKPLNRSITVVCAIFIVLLSIVLSLVTFRIYTTAMYGKFQSDMTNVITYVQSHIDNDDLAECVETLTESKKYKKLQTFMDDFVDHYDVHYLYILKPLNANPTYNMMSVCSASTTYEKENEPEMVLHLGDTPEDAYSSETAQEFIDILNGKELVFFVEKTEWGTDYTAAQPLMTSEGEPYAILCVDESIDDIQSTIYVNTAVNIALIIVLGVLFILLLLIWMRANVTLPIKRLEQSVVAYAMSSHDKQAPDELIFHAPEIHTDNEVESLSQAVTKMSFDMRDYVNNMIEAEDKVEVMQHHVDRMNTIAYQDALTHVKNKAAYDKMVESLEWDILNQGAEFAIVMIDLNFLKRINDRYGHDRGNEYIIGGCNIICEVYDHSPVYRVGGDEFVVVLRGRDYRNREELLEIVQREFRTVASNSDADPWNRYSAAFGMAVFLPGEDENVDMVFKRADDKMYANKTAMKAKRE